MVYVANEVIMESGEHIIKTNSTEQHTNEFHASQLWINSHMIHDFLSVHPSIYHLELLKSHIKNFTEEIIFSGGES